MVAVTNRLDGDDYGLVQGSVGNRYPVGISLGVAVNDRPIDALEAATDRVQVAGSAQDEGRSEALAGEYRCERGDGDVSIAHFDVVDATGTYTDRLNEFDTFVNIEAGYASLMRYMREHHGALSFFLGGDNVIAVAPDVDRDAYRPTVDHVGDDIGVDPVVGVGYGPTPESRRARRQTRPRRVPVRG